MEHLFDLYLPSQRLLIPWKSTFPPATDLCPLDLPSNTTRIILSSHTYTHDVSRLRSVCLRVEGVGGHKEKGNWLEREKKNYRRGGNESQWEYYYRWRQIYVYDAQQNHLQEESEQYVTSPAFLDRTGWTGSDCLFSLDSNHPDAHIVIYAEMK